MNNLRYNKLLTINQFVSGLDFSIYRRYHIDVFSHDIEIYIDNYVSMSSDITEENIRNFSRDAKLFSINNFAWHCKKFKVEPDVFDSHKNYNLNILTRGEALVKGVKLL